MHDLPICRSSDVSSRFPVSNFSARLKAIRWRGKLSRKPSNKRAPSCLPTSPPADRVCKAAGKQATASRCFEPGRPHRRWPPRCRPRIAQLLVGNDGSCHNATIAADVVADSRSLSLAARPVLARPTGHLCVERSANASVLRFFRTAHGHTSPHRTKRRYAIAT